MIDEVACAPAIPGRLMQTKQGRTESYRGTAAARKYPLCKRREMAYYITEDCINCAACEPECPNQAISEGDIIYVINPGRCTECVGAHEAPHCAAVCPVDTCQPDPSRPETRQELLEKWRRLHPGKEPAPGTY